EAVTIEPALEPGVEAIAADGGLERAQECRALLVGDIAQAFVGMPALKVELEARIGPARPPILGDRLVHRIDAQRAMLIARLLAVQLLDDPALGISRHPLVKPEVVPRRIRREIARPAVGELVRDEADEALVAGDKG